MASATDILVDYLKRCVGHSVASHDIEVEVPRHGEMVYRKKHNGGTYSREFRKLRESSELQKSVGLNFKEINREGKEKSWSIISNTHSAALTQETPFVC